MRVSSILVSLVLLCSACLSGCSGLFFVPDRKLALSPDQLGLDYSNIFIPTKDGAMLHGWLLKGRKPVRGTVLFLHGNAQNISYHIASVSWLPSRHYNVLLYDYRGYGKSTGSPTIENSIEDFSSVMALLDSKLDKRERNLTVFGQSLGGAFAIAAVADYKGRLPVRTLVIDSAFAGFRLIAHEKMSDLLLLRPFSGALKLLFTNQPDLLSSINRISPIPVLVLHGLNDKIVPPDHARQLYHAAREPKLLHLQPGAGHIQSLLYPEVRHLMLDFMERHKPDQRLLRRSVRDVSLLTK